MSHSANALNSPNIYARIARKIDSSMIQQNYVDKLSLSGIPGPICPWSQTDDDRPGSSDVIGNIPNLN